MHRSDRLRPLTRVFLSCVFFVLLCSPAFPAAPGTIAGRVIDPAGAVVAGAQVIVTSGNEVVARTDSDPRGAFEVTGLTPDRYELHVIREGFRSSPVTVDFAAGDAPEITLRLQVSAVSEAVVVSAAEVDLPLSRTPATTSVITRDDLRVFQHAVVADALGRVPGVSVGRTGVEGAVTSLFSRGGESDFTAVAIDGVPVNSFGGSFDFGQLTTGDVQRIEVVRGPQSALWSGAAIGGAINIITGPDARNAVDASAGAGSRGTDGVAASGAVAAGDWRLSFGGERQTSDGLNGRTFDAGRVANDDWRAEHVSAGVRRDGPTRLSVTTRFERSERGYPGAYGSDPGGTFGGIDEISRGRSRAWTIGASGSRAFARVRPSVQATWFSLDNDFTDPFGPSESGSRRVTARGQADVRLASWINTTAGAEWLQERATSTYITGTAGTGIPVERSVGSVFAEARLEAGPAFFTAGLRVEDIRRDRLDADPYSFSPRPELPHDTVTAVTPRLAASWFVSPVSDRGNWTRLRASAGLGIRPPDAFELAFTDNPELKPERTRSAELGVEQALAGGRLVVDATAFVNQYDDLIVTVGRTMSDASRYQSDNISNARARGVEALVSGRGPNGLSATATYTFMDAEVLAIDRLGVAPPPFRPGDPLIRRPRHHGWMEASWRGAAGDVFVSVGGRGRTLDIDPSFGAFGGLFRAPGFAVATAGGSWRVAPAVQLFGRVSNLFDRRYEEVLGFPAPPRSVYAGIRVSVR